MLTLSQRWRSFTDELGVPAGASDAAFAKIVKRYGKPRRFYHTLGGHIAACLAEFDLVKADAHDPLAVQGALWLHDAYYSTWSSRNEQNSARWAERLFKEMGLESLGHRIAQLILATRHADVPTDPDARLLCDIDLAILGKPEEVFNEYDRNIRREYRWVPERTFRSKRAEILKSFMARPVLYHHLRLRELYEAPARQNLLRSIEKLEK